MNEFGRKLFLSLERRHWPEKCVQWLQFWHQFGLIVGSFVGMGGGLSGRILRVSVDKMKSYEWFEKRTLFSETGV